MKSILSAQRTRYTATVMLFVWLMSLGIGIANACLLPQIHSGHEPLSHDRSGFWSEALVEHDAAWSSFAKVQAKNGANDQSPEKPLCLDFCAAEQNTLVKHHADGLVAQDLVPVLYLTWLLVPGLDQTPQPEAFGRPTWSEPPVSIRYLRLTI
jgi:hypothetical protein